MAKIKIVGYSELIEVSQDTAREIEKIWRDDKCSRDTKITVGNISVTKGDIKAVFLDRSNLDYNPHEENLRDYYDKRNKILWMPAKDRAKVNSWGHFSLFYYAAFKKKPDPNLRKEVEEQAAEFFQKNPKWSVPSLKIWFDYLKLTDSQSFYRQAFMILERIESNELEDIRNENR